MRLELDALILILASHLHLGLVSDHFPEVFLQKFHVNRLFCYHGQVYDYNPPSILVNSPYQTAYKVHVFVM